MVGRRKSTFTSTTYGQTEAARACLICNAAMTTHRVRGCRSSCRFRRGALALLPRSLPQQRQTLPLHTWHGQLGFGHGFDRSLDPLLHCWPMCRPQTLPPALHATCVCTKDRSGQAGVRGQGMAAVSACLSGCTNHTALWWLQLVTPPRQATGQAFKSPLKPAPTAVPAAVPVAAAAPLAAPAPAPAAPPLATMTANSRGRCRRGCAGAVAGGRWLVSGGRGARLLWIAITLA